MGSPRITYAHNPDTATPRAEISALANVYRFVLERKEAATSSVCRPDDGTKSKEDSANEHIIQ